MNFLVSKLHSEPNQTTSDCLDNDILIKERNERDSLNINKITAQTFF